MGRLSNITCAAFVAIGAAMPAPAGAVEAPFEANLMRISEVLGSLHFLRNLCGEKGNQWRGEMEKLIAAENPDPARKAQLTASFNRGYRSFEGTYSSCTASAMEAISRYMKEGEALTRDTAVKFGN
jgi:uncharacterized protein (TIGR02301 family)